MPEQPPQSPRPDDPADGRFRAIIDSALDAVITMDESGRVVDWNHQAEEIFGRSASEAEGRLLAELVIPPEQREAHRRALDRYLRTGESTILGRRVELTAIRKGGETFPVELSVVEAPRQPAGGALFNAFVRDITTRSSDAEYRVRMAALVDSSADAIIGKDVDGTITSWNQGAVRVYGYSEDEAVGRTVSLILPPGAAGEEREIQHAMRTGQRLVQFEAVRQRKDRRLIPVSITISPIADARGTITGSSSIERDITDSQRDKEELRRAKNDAETATRAQSEFLANVSHELRTPMNAIIGMTQLALEEQLSEDVRDYIETAHDSAHSLLTLLNDILDFSKLESGTFTIETSPFLLRESIGDAVRPLSAQAEEKGLQLRWDIGDAVPDHLIGDSARLRQIVTNLVGNAIKFTDRGEVELQIKSLRNWRQESRLVFSVRDTGVGISAEDQRRILEPFAQADASATRRHGGTGLGLAICTELLHLMGSRLSIESEPGRGSCFSFRLLLPRARGVSADSAAEQQAGEDGQWHPGEFRSIDSQPPPPGGPLRVLVAEDTPANQKVITRILKRRGHSVAIAADGREAVSKFSERPYDVVLMDVQMPVLDGLSATAEIRRLEAGDEPTPIIALTAHAMRGDRERCLRAGMDGYLAKPIDVHELIDLVESLSSGGRSAPDADDESVTAGVGESVSEEAAPVIDYAAVMRRLAGDEELFREFIGYYEEDAPGLLQAAGEAIGAGAADALRRAAHSLKGLAGNVGAAACQQAAAELEQAAAEIERAADKGGFDAARMLLEQLRRETQRLDRALAEHRG